MPFIDLHCDTIARLLAARRGGAPGSLGQGTAGGQVDLEKLRRSGVLLQTFALFVNLEGDPLPTTPATGPEDLYARSMDCRGADPLEEVLTLADLYWQEVEANAHLVQPVLSFADLERARRTGKTGTLLAVEEGGVCRGQLPLLRTLHRLGVRLLTLTWNYPNQLAAPNGQAGGLTETGRAVLAEMEALGMLADLEAGQARKKLGANMILGVSAHSVEEALGMLADVSHLGDEGFWDVCRLAKRPFLASHSCCRALRDHRRNLTDAMLRALGDRGCLVGVNFSAGLLGSGPVSRLEVLARHLRHIIDTAGLAAAALGSDFDGIDCPLELEDAGHLDRLLPALDRAGFTHREIEAVCWQNAWDFFRRTLP